MASSIVLKNELSLGFKDSKGFSFLLPIFFTNLFAYVCGSIIKGHRLALNMIIPFSTLKSSFGKAIYVPFSDQNIIS
jgi:hypothetical protein